MVKIRIDLPSVFLDVDDPNDYEDVSEKLFEAINKYGLDYTVVKE